MSLQNELPVDLLTIGQQGDLIKIVKIESPVGVKLFKSPRGGFINSTPKKKTASKIRLAEPITVGEQIIKEAKKGNKNDGRSVKKFYATLSKVRKIEQTNENIYVYTRNCKYKIVF
jgi:hypothetical protein